MNHFKVNFYVQKRHLVYASVPAVLAAAGLLGILLAPAGQGRELARDLEGVDGIQARLCPEEAAPAEPWEGLAPGFRALLRDLVARMERRGYELVLLEGLRGPGRQTALLARDATKAGPWESLHQYGHAGDFAFRRGSSLASSEADPWVRDAYLALGEEAEALGLTWGGRFSRPDPCHVELPFAASRFRP